MSNEAAETTEKQGEATADPRAEAVAVIEAAVEAQRQAQKDGENANPEAKVDAEPDASQTTSEQEDKPEDGAHTQTDVKAELPPEVLHIAKRAKMSEEVALALWQSSPESLMALKRSQDDLSARFSAFGKAQKSGKQEEATPQPEKPTDKAPAEPDYALDEYDQPTAKAVEQAVKRLMEPLMGELSTIKGFVEPLMNQRRQQVLTQYLDAVDGYLGTRVGGKDDAENDYSKIYGRGKSVGIDAKHPHGDARKALLEEALIISQAATSLGEQIPLEGAIDRAFSYLHRDLEEKRLSEEIAARAKKRAAGAVPSVVRKRGRAEASTREGAIAEIGAMVAKKRL